MWINVQMKMTDETQPKAVLYESHITKFLSSGLTRLHSTIPGRIGQVL